MRGEWKGQPLLSGIYSKVGVIRHRTEIEDKIFCSLVGCGRQALIPAGRLSSVLGTASLGSDFLGRTGFELGL